MRPGTHCLQEQHVMATLTNCCSLHTCGVHTDCVMAVASLQSCMLILCESLWSTTRSCRNFTIKSLKFTNERILSAEVLSEGVYFEIERGKVERNGNTV